MPLSKLFKGSIAVVFASSLFCGGVFAQKQDCANVPLAGNAYIVQGTENGARISQRGLNNWTNGQTTTDIFFYIKKPVKVSIALICASPDGQSTFSAKIMGKRYLVNTKAGSTDTLKIAELDIAKPGYVQLEIQGVKKEGHSFGNLSAVLLQGSKITQNLAYVADAKDFYFGRRGPSVHWNFVIPEKIKNQVEYFYNEIYVPKGNDVVGSYFEADGFSFGYFGMQVNSPTERHILFSVWSPFKTNTPGEIPEGQKIKLIKKGKNVHGGEFGGEGSGGQSRLEYNWKPATHYAFLLKAEPDSIHNTTTFTAYFKEVSAENWLLIASFQRPQTNTSLKDLYSFLENFSPDMGNIQRRGYYTNQWVRTFSGKWTPIDQASFTTDATGNAGIRMDYGGGVANGDFYLENCGFFSPGGENYRRKTFTRDTNNKLPPKIDFDKLP
ncbi:DUF3472 domain-containing protein [Arachidicoccus sp.]|uniref:DUF3472 domain-containing protein n=1 Tax=Arachidicoccus sp. TaxID=1872624 RepID=UPI003D1E789D